MSKNRDRRPSGKPQSPSVESEREAFPGGEVGDSGVDDRDTEGIIEKVFEEDMRKNLGSEVADVLLGEKGRNRGRGHGEGEEDRHIIELKSGEKNRLHRAEMHLNFLILELTAIANEGALIGPFRKACAECRVVFNDSNAALWEPLKSVGAVLSTVKKNSGV